MTKSRMASPAERGLRERVLGASPIPVGYRISYLANFFVGPVYAEISRSCGLARSEFVVLFCLRNVGELTAQDVCQITGRPKNSVSQAVTKLAAAGLIRRRTDEQDARRAILGLTTRGRELYERLIPLFRLREEQMLAVLTPREREQFERLLRKLTLRPDDWENAPVTERPDDPSETA